MKRNVLMLELQSFALESSTNDHNIHPCLSAFKHSCSHIYFNKTWCCSSSQAFTL